MSAVLRGFVTYGTERQNEVSKIVILPLRLIGRAEKKLFKFSGPYNEIRPEKLTNHTVRSKRYNKWIYHMPLRNKN